MPTPITNPIADKGRGTHHSISSNDDGILTINGKNYNNNNFKTLSELVSGMSVQQKGWPVVLSTPINATKVETKPVEVPSILVKETLDETLAVQKLTTPVIAEEPESALIVSLLF